MSAPIHNQAAFPVKNRQIAVKVGKEATEIVCSIYEDRIFCIVTQYQKVGTLVNVTKDLVLDESGISSHTYNTKVLLGQDEPLTHVVAKNLVSGIDTTKPILVGMALKEKSPDTVSALGKIVSDLVKT